MQPSSLIFVLVVAIWAVYLLQYWIKRRDHLSTIRSVDRFSAAMRVLDDHRMSRGAEPTPRSYAVAPTRAARPEVTVKHAAAPQPAPRTVSTPVERAPSRSTRRVRGVTVLTTAASLPVLVLVAAVGLLPWWVPVVGLVGTVAAFLWLRRAVMAERAARRRTTQRRAPRVERPATVRPSDPAGRRGAPVATPVEVPVAAEPVARTRSTRVYDIVEEQRPEQPAELVAPGAGEGAEPAAQAPEPGSWEPTPVPRPMYTMKAKAPRPEPAPVETAAAPAADVPQVIDVEDEDLPAIAGWG